VSENVVSDGNFVCLRVWLVLVILCLRVWILMGLFCARVWLVFGSLRV
jgi:hypothetical protein